MGSYHNLDNEEVVFIYLSNRRFIDQYNAIFEQGGLETVADITPDSYIVTFRPFDEEQLLQMMDDTHYKYCLGIDEKLKPIVELIREELPDLYKKVTHSFVKYEG
ncbi:hypothetical protein EBU95_16980 [bacterium]|jgi:hypothetical protein|nr:hypothetical protein [bacterium]